MSYYREHPGRQRLLTILSFILMCCLWVFASAHLARLMLYSGITLHAALTAGTFVVATAIMAGVAEAYSSLNAQKASFTALCAVPLLGISGVFFTFGWLRSCHSEGCPELWVLSVSIAVPAGLLLWRKRWLKQAK